MLAFTKLLGMLLMPLGLLWLGLLLAAGWAFRRKSYGLGAFLALLWLGCGLAGNPQVGHALIGRLEVQIPALPQEAPSLEALFVLGGGTQVDAQGKPFLSDGGDRVAEAARLWHSGRAKLLVASGGSRDRAEGRDLGLETALIWRDLGIPAAAIRVIEEPCFITRTEIQAYHRLKARESWQRVGLLSSAWHLPRALALAKREGLEVIPVPSDRRGRVPQFQLWHLVPQNEGLHYTQLACWEWLGRRMGR